MHQIADQLAEYDCFFSQLYSDHPLIKMAVKWKWLDTTIMGGEFKRKADAYLQEHGLRNDYARLAYNNTYDLVVFCSDMLVTPKLKKLKTIWVQEGMTDPITSWGKIVHALKLPSYIAGNTAFNGAANICDIYCAASEGYKKQFTDLGTDPSRIFVTGIPNYDNIETFLRNDFPYSDYVLVTTSDIRETFNKEDRPAFIKQCAEIAAGRQLIFKLHPNEQKDRAIAEIKEYAPPGTLTYTDQDPNVMIANCEELITQYSTLVYVGIALGKKVYSYFDVEKLKALTPVQNGGISAMSIAALCRSYIEFKGSRDAFLQTYRLPKPEPQLV